MPANLTPQYHDAEQRFKEATTQADKIAALEEMLRQIPKHKGTEKMQADIKRRLAKVRKEGQGKQAAAAHRPFWQIDREGIGQVVLCGPPNGGKSQLLDLLTHARPEVAPYPFTTRVPQTGMLDFEDVQIQLIDMPPLAPETFESWNTAVIAQADIAVLLFDVNDPLILDQTDFVRARLEERRISWNSSSGRPKVLILGNKVDQPGGLENFRAWQDLFQDEFEARPFSCLSETNRNALSRGLFDMLDVVRVYTKRPGHAPERDSAPFVLKKGSTVVDAARAVHQDLASIFKYARVWGHARFEGQMVERTYVVEDGDLIEIHA